MRQAQMNSDIVNDMDAVAGLLNAEQATQKRIQDMLSGVLPPPSVTIIEYDCNNMMLMFKKHYVEMDNSMNCTDGTEVVNNSTAVMPAKLENVEWPQIRECNEFGLHYNRTKYSESIEMLYMRLAERNVGLETGSSFLSGISTNIRKKPPKKLIASPGNRLSHLARRRAIFSSANLLAQSQLSHLSKLGRKPCVIDTSNKKLSRKDKVTTPKRRLFGTRHTPGRRTPSSLKKSGRKANGSATKPNILSRETSKRALFMSPTQDKSAKVAVASEMTCRIEKSKRALFSPPRRLERSISNISAASSTSLSDSINKLSQQYDSHLSVISQKRKRETYNEENMEPQRLPKLARFQSQSTSSQPLASTHSALHLPKASSESAMYPSQQLSASHKQKLLWAVSTALKKKSINTGHENFNHFAAVLAKVVKRLYLESSISKAESTSATMLRLADRLVFFVIQGKSVDEIYLEEKARVGATKNATKRLSGYINRDDYFLHQSASSDASNTSNIPANNDRPSLTNSSSKSNASVLRENHDSKSAQKIASSLSFSGRNQKNLSPYNDKPRASFNQSVQNKVIVGGSGSSLHSNIMKVKRQISFDS